ncbi:MAG: DUF799 domain-containing protein [Bacteroidales bacterium]|nr:DUF799 domain-containing protein [Bacteroidales bacterium]MCF8389080.1 DUF799 domain-containing protein [Bacteroidales bacterium]
MKRYIIFGIFLIPFLFSSCTTTKLTKQQAYPKMYEENPLSLVVAPPINNETAADAGEYYLSTIAIPTTLQGFYIFPIPIVMDILKDEGAYNTIHEIPQPVIAQKMYELFGADATLFTNILKWDKKYRVTAASVVVLIDYRIVSGKTGEILWSHAKEVAVDTSVDTGAGGIAGLIADAVLTAASTALTDYVPVARAANNYAMIPLPYGKYHPSFGLDKETKVVVYKSKIEESGGGLEPDTE